MSLIKVQKIETTQVGVGAIDVMGFTISTHSETEQFNHLGSATLNTSLMSAENAATVEAFIAIVNAALLDS